MDNNPNSRNFQVTTFYLLGFDPIPLTPDGKLPISKGWERIPSHRQWRSAPPDANIGLRAGGRDKNAAFIDCDEKNQAGTYPHVVDFLGGLGLSGYPVVSTASQVGRQIYLSLSNPIDGNYCQLARDIGAGEFRYGPGAYVVAEPSVVDGVSYSLLAGDYSNLPSVDPKDLKPILGNPDTTRPGLPVKAAYQITGKLEQVYPSRSENEQGFITRMINQGFSLEQVTEVFLQFQPGKFGELYAKNPKTALRWLAHSYQEAREWALTHENPERTIIRGLIAQAKSKPWPGRSGISDRAVYLAHLSKAFAAGGMTYGASVRDLAELAGTGSVTAWRGTKRLKASGLLELFLEGNSVDAATIYKIKSGLNETLPHNGYLGSVSDSPLSEQPLHNAFRGRKRLGKPAAEVYYTLTASGPLTPKELVEKTGRCDRTIRRALARLASVKDTRLGTGEVVAMVERSNGGRWAALAVDLNHIAEMLGTSHAAENQKRKHDRERRAHRRIFIKAGGL